MRIPAILWRIFGDANSDPDCGYFAWLVLTKCGIALVLGLAAWKLVDIAIWLAK